MKSGFISARLQALNFVIPAQAGIQEGDEVTGLTGMNEAVISHFTPRRFIAYPLPVWFAPLLLFHHAINLNLRVSGVYTGRKSWRRIITK